MHCVSPLTLYRRAYWPGTLEAVDANVYEVPLIVWVGVGDVMETDCPMSPTGMRSNCKIRFITNFILLGDALQNIQCRPVVKISLAHALFGRPRSDVPNLLKRMIAKMLVLV
jgi:hypothetical protein